MLLDCKQPVRGIDGKPLKAEGDDVTIEYVVVRALTEPIAGPDGRPETVQGPEKLTRWQLAGRIHNAPGPVQITVEEATKIKQLVDKMFTSPGIYARIHEAIEGAVPDPDKPSNAGQLPAGKKK